MKVDLKHKIAQLSLDDKRLFYEMVSGFCNEERKALFETIITNRTKHVTIVLEDLYQPQNASATLRTSEIMGLQDVYIIENEHTYEVNPDIVIGASKWIDYTKFNKQDHNTKTCLRYLKKEGYTLVATLPNEPCISIEELDVTQKTAFIFGCEKNGLSEIAKQESDVFVRIPMFGFTESYNISVSVALCLYDFTMRMRNSDANWQLAENEKLEIMIEWVRRSLNKADMILEHLIHKHFSTY